MNAMLDIYASWFRLHIGNALQYRVIIALWQLASLVEVTVALSVWGAVTKVTGGEVGGYAQADFAAYFVLAMLAGELTHTWIVWIWAWRVGEGTFAGCLVRPSHPLHGDLMDNAAVKVLSMSVKTPIAVAIAWTFGAQFEATAPEWAAFCVAMLLAWVLRALLESILACVAFWLVRVSALVHTWYVVFFITSGAFAPIALMPDWLGHVASVLPMRWVIEFPVQVGMGRLAWSEIALGLLAQCGWIAVAWLGFRAAWSVTQRHFTAVGS